jgi:hypothetical protein
MFGWGSVGSVGSVKEILWIFLRQRPEGMCVVCVLRKIDIFADMQEQM